MIPVLIILVLVMGFAGTAISVYNMLIRRKNLVAEAWSGIDVQLKRRYDLIPNVLETVKEYARHERGLLETIGGMKAGLREARSVRERIETENQFTGALKSVFALAEAYPDLKASGNFQGLQDTLRDVEDQIQMARRYYNGTAREYNILIESFPSNIIARIFHHEKVEFFDIDLAMERDNPKVQFS